MCIYVQTERAKVAQSIKLHERWKILKFITLAEVLGAVGLHQGGLSWPIFIV